MLVPDMLVVDANPIISTLLGGRARDVLFSQKIVFFAAQHTLFEVEKFIPHLANRIGLSELHLLESFQLLPVVPCQPRVYDPCVEHATRLIGVRDPKDIHVLALALRFGHPIWTEDQDFQGLPSIQVFRTRDLLEMLAQ